MKNKVLFILHVPPPIHGASMVGKYIRESELINKNFDADFINLSISPSVTKIGQASFKKIFTYFKLIFSVITALLSKKYDLCYITISASGPGFLKDVLIIIIIKCFRKKILYHFHNKGVKANSDFRLKHILYKYIFKNTKCILLSPLLYIDIKKYVKEKNVFYCPNGIPALKVPCQLPNSHNIAVNGNCKILFLSNMIMEKGVFVLLEACKILRANNIKFECHFAGAWSDVTESQFNDYLIKYDLINYVFAHGQIIGKGKMELFCKSDLFVLPTYYHFECFPLVILEAMSFGLPVISTSEGAISDIIINNETGFVIKPQDSKLLAEKISILINDKSRRIAYGYEGRERFNKFFTQEKFENRMVEILYSILAE